MSDFTKQLFRRLFSYCTTVILLSFLTLLSSLSIGMRKQLASPQHSIHGVKREVNAPTVLLCISASGISRGIVLRFSLEQDL